MTTELSFKPLKRNLWTDFEELFGPRGACAGCWCMFWKLRGKAFDEVRGYETRQMHKSIEEQAHDAYLLSVLPGTTRPMPIRDAHFHGHKYPAGELY